MNAIAPIGHNNPPEPAPFEAISVHVSDLMVEARAWCDGAQIENQEQADVVARLIDEFRQAQKAADDARREEAKPHDEAKARIQEKYAPLLAETKTKTGAIPRALAALKATLTPWLRKLEDERRAREEAARQEAAAKAKAAADAMRAADASNLEAREAAEAMVQDARVAESAANAVGREKAHAKGDGRAIGLRKTYRAVMTDRKAALIHYASTQPDALTAFLQQLADRDVREGKRQIPGFDVLEEATL
ncbi:hypothetical protein ACO2Q0_02885 [Phenylobacterium sp. VNQ135]|uniref:hypothetical protein n=1 Tax=Phenylobacterium sp. VNQ135 TaxID=3400922 RepID=UPI003C0FC568